MLLRPRQQSVMHIHGSHALQPHWMSCSLTVASRFAISSLVAPCRFALSKHCDEQGQEVTLAYYLSPNHYE